MTPLERIARAANPNWGSMSRNDRRNALITAQAHVRAVALEANGETNGCLSWQQLDALAKENVDGLA